MPFELIPAIDLRGGRAVRLLQGDYDRETVFDDDPVAVARRWEAEGAPRLHVVDLEGARDGTATNREVIARIIAAVTIPVQVSGGLRDVAAVDAVLALGAARAIIGTIAADPEKARPILAAFGEQIVVGIDARDGRVAVRGWRETLERDAVELAQELVAAGARRVIFTDIGRDGMLAGPNLEAMRRMATAVPIPVIASGGVGSVDDVRRLADLGCLEGVIVGRALYTGNVSLPEALAQIRARNAGSGRSS
jgi:phosphoribosylformimino-5-aminoimidazole carboxamide ribotide isomerase